jgi:hypothetical protein
MSHIVTVRTQVRDPAALAAACRRLGLEPPAVGAAQLYSGRAEGHLVSLPGWRYPVVFDTAAGQARYDNFAGRWGDQRKLDQLLQLYAVEKAKLEARRRGHSVAEQPLLDGSIRLVIREGAATAGGGGGAA